jgi:hypothetical protein
MSSQEGIVEKLRRTAARRLLKIFDSLVPAIPKRPQKEVDAELVEIRAARRRWGSRRRTRGA